MFYKTKEASTISNQDLQGKSVIIYGTSTAALKRYLKLIEEKIPVVGFTDSFTTISGGQFADLPLYTTEELRNMKDIVIYIATKNLKFKKEIMERLKGFEEVDIYAFGKIIKIWDFYNVEYMKQQIKTEANEINFIREHLKDDLSIKVFENLLKLRTTNDIKLLLDLVNEDEVQYFPKDGVIIPESEEVFIDAGAYYGDSSENFHAWTKGNYSRIYLMEPAQTTIPILKEYIKIKKLHDTHVICKGAFSEAGQLYFCEGNGPGNSITSQGDNKIEVISIDEMLQGDKATYIKMDIEGAEMAALLGAQNTIRKYKPKLAICIYHKPDDLWKIPTYILKEYPWYKIYIRHYSYDIFETVLYATT